MISYRLNITSMIEAKVAVAAGDYAASNGTTGGDADLVLTGGVIVPQNGAFRGVDGITFAEILDGLGNTILIGEKHIPPGGAGKYPYDCGLYDGHMPACSQRSAGPLFPLAASGGDPGWKFGGPHPGLCNFAFCDGTVRSLSSTIDPNVLGLLAQRNDGQPIPDD